MHCVLFLDHVVYPPSIGHDISPFSESTTVLYVRSTGGFQSTDSKKVPVVNINLFADLIIILFCRRANQLTSVSLSVSNICVPRSLSRSVAEGTSVLDSETVLLAKDSLSLLFGWNTRTPCPSRIPWLN